MLVCHYTVRNCIRKAKNHWLRAKNLIPETYDKPDFKEVNFPLNTEHYKKLFRGSEGSHVENYIT